MSKTIRELMSELRPDWDGHIIIYQNGKEICFRTSRNSIPEEFLDRELCGYEFFVSKHLGSLINVAKLEVKPEDKKNKKEAIKELVLTYDPAVTFNVAYRQDRRIACFDGHVCFEEYGRSGYLGPYLHKDYSTVFWGTSVRAIPDNLANRKIRKIEFLKHPLRDKSAAEPNPFRKDMMVIYLAKSEEKPSVLTLTDKIRRIDFIEETVNSVGPVSGEKVGKEMSAIFNTDVITEAEVLSLINTGSILYNDKVACMSRKQAENIFAKA